MPSPRLYKVDANTMKVVVWSLIIMGEKTQSNI